MSDFSVLLICITVIVVTASAVKCVKLYINTQKELQLFNLKTVSEQPTPAKKPLYNDFLADINEKM